MAFKLASLFVQIDADDSPLRGALGRTHGLLDGLGTKLAGLGAAVGVGAGLVKAIQGATDLAETQSKVNTVFGDDAGVVLGFADEAAKKFGLVKQPVLDAAAVFGLMAKGAGMANGEAAGFSNSMAMLAADAASFYNVPLDVALEKIRSGLSGESEPLRAFGVFLSDAAVKAQAAAMGLGTLNGELTEGEKISARAALIQQGLATANGDLARTLDGTANQQRKLMGDLTNALNDFGASIMPVWNSILGVASEAMSGVNAWLTTNKEAIRGFAVEASGWLLDAADSIATFAGDGVALAGWFGRNWSNLLFDAINGTLTLFVNLGENIVSFFEELWGSISTLGQDGFDWQAKGLLDGFEAVTEQMPEMGRKAVHAYRAGMEDAAASPWDLMGKAMSQIAGPAAGAGATPVAKAAAAIAEPERNATTSTLEGFASRLIEGAFGDKKHREQLKALEAIKLEIAKGNVGAGPLTGVALAG
jgi:hypothetical protein